MTFGENLRAFRVAANMTQEQFAKKLGMQKQNISRYENSEREPNIKTAKRMADILGVSLEELAGDYPPALYDPSESVFELYGRLNRLESDRQEYFGKLFLSIMNGDTRVLDPTDSDYTSKLLILCWNRAEEDDRQVVLAALRKYGFHYQEEHAESDVG